MVLETERFLLRQMDEGDFDDLCQMLRDPEVMYAYEHAFSEEESREWLERQMGRYAKYGFGLWAVVEKATGEMVGQVGLTMQDCDGEEKIEIGYLLKKAHWHRGIATEASLGCKQYAFETLGASEVCSIIRDNNIASQNVALRVGMKPGKVFVKHYYGVVMPHIVFTVTKQAV